MIRLMQTSTVVFMVVLFTSKLVKFDLKATTYVTIPIVPHACNDSNSAGIAS
jgi:hypothetical protein